MCSPRSPWSGWWSPPAWPASGPPRRGDDRPGHAHECGCRYRPGPLRPTRHRRGLTDARVRGGGHRLVFGMPGGAILPAPAYDALLDASAIRRVLVRHEQGAPDALATGRAGGCVASSGRPSGPGATDLVTAIADAHAHAHAHAKSVPPVVITGQAPRSLPGRNSFQEVDICAPHGRSHGTTGRSKLFDRHADAADEEPEPVLVDIAKDTPQQQVPPPTIHCTPPARRPGLAPAVPAIPAGDHADAPPTPESVTAAVARG
ncbi:thiamine pyrophosphate-binding protein [Streptomyces sp. URMC 126]|uniref:thiamine pyrophosphate-binding protein n=1 Tax=Streptomyces sp. URMC 126 TaxID=3423401 RepID=UPI003F1C2457